MVNSEIPDKERLYRAIFLDWWNFKRCAISPAAFIDSQGVSVDRESDRSSDAAIDFLKRRFYKMKLKAVCTLTAGQCRSFSTYVFYNRTRNDPYHTSIWDSSTVTEISPLKAYNLSVNAKLEFIDDNLTI